MDLHRLQAHFFFVKVLSLSLIFKANLAVFLVFALLLLPCLLHVCETAQRWYRSFESLAALLLYSGKSLLIMDSQYDHSIVLEISAAKSSLPLLFAHLEPEYR